MLRSHGVNTFGQFSHSTARRVTLWHDIGGPYHERNVYSRQYLERGQETRMVHCTHDDCGWHAIAPSPAAAKRQYATHLVEEHASEVDADIPDGKVQVRIDEDDEWRTMTFEQAKTFHEAVNNRDG